MRPYTLEDVIQPYKNYPKVIQNAILLAHTHPAFLVLTRSARKVLYALLTRASQRDGTLPIKARIDRLAAEAGVSEKTVQRTIATFRETGWLTQAERRSEFGLFSSRQYCFSPALCELVRLPLKQSVEGPLPQETKMSDGPIYIDLSFKEDQRGISLKQRKGRPVDLPDTLQDASRQFAIRPTGIAKLRGIAHAAGHQLEHIVAVARCYIERAGLTGNRAYRYLESMATRSAQQVDYAARALQNERLATEQARAGKVLALAERCRNKRFIGPAGLVVRVFENAAELVQDGAYTTLPHADLPRIYAMVEAGMLKEAEPGTPAASAVHRGASRRTPAQLTEHAGMQRMMHASSPKAAHSATPPAASSHLEQLRSIVGLAKKKLMADDSGNANDRRAGPVPRHGMVAA